MSDLPPNINSERRSDAGARKTIDLLQAGLKLVQAGLNELKGNVDTEFKLVRLEIKGLGDSKLSSSAVIAVVVALCLAATGGTIAFTNSLWAKVDARFEKWDGQREKTEAQLQRLEISAAKSDGMWRLIGEKQNPAVVRQQVEERTRELTPPPAPINPLAPRAGRR